MVRSKGPDDCRIPSSIFERTKSTAPVEWSVASNESLFSIHAGNSSFSRDYLFLSGMSGELPNFSISPGPQAPGTISAQLQNRGHEGRPGSCCNWPHRWKQTSSRSGSVKVERTQHQQQQKKPAEPEESSSSSPAVALGAQQKSWFSCFCCGFYR
ncbi:unnamed protein product [Spirodela intermedia]|uniref:Uncharacterized protein n=1 Tax=Spirodela intermedia TaxID=51605 RepID=A0A7I8ILS1_SPIIN|nr:unnamed protein product [Spirodela intermedia]CAA6658886.1 unnamed protein product [Spirodela intermedia]